MTLCPMIIIKRIQRSISKKVVSNPIKIVMFEKYKDFGSHHHYWVSLEFGSKVKVFCFFFEYLHLSSILAANFFESLYVCSPLLKRKEVSVFHTTLFRGWLSENSVGFKKKLSVDRIPFPFLWSSNFLIQDCKPT